MATDKRILTRESCPLHYRIHGDKRRPWIVLCHGASLDSGMFDRQVPSLVNAGYCVVTWDLRGHGLSQPMGDRFSFDIATDDLIAILQAEGVGRVIVVGHSGGGYVAQKLLFARPGMVKAVAVIGSTDLSRRPPGHLAIAYRLMPFLYRLIPDPLLRRLFAKHMGVTEEARLYALGATNRIGRAAFIKIFRAASKTLLEGFRQAGPITRPFLITHGEFDNTNRGIVRDGAPDWAAESKQAEYRVIPNAGHNANQDNPEGFNAVLIAWLNDLKE